MFDENCDTTNTANRTPTETQSGTFLSQTTLTKSINIYTQVLTYCTRDNAGNTLRGVYPVINSGCFSASNISPLPKIDTYHDSLLARLKNMSLNDNQKYGYSFSENSTDASCFRSIISNNITTLITNQFTPKSETTLDNWDLDRALVKNTNILNTNGYYYYIYPTVNTLDIVASPTGTGTKSVVVEGGNIHITNDLNYTGVGKTLLLIARKNNA